MLTCPTHGKPQPEAGCAGCAAALRRLASRPRLTVRCSKCRKLVRTRVIPGESFKCPGCGGTYVLEASQVDKQASPSSDEPTTRFSTGQRVGDCVLERPIGRGGFGEVWKVQFAGQTAAVKLPIDARGEEALQAEASALQRLNHERVIRMLHNGTREAEPHLVLEYVDGLNLRGLLAKRRRLEPDATLRLIAELLSAIEHALAAGLYHGDLKPENVLLPREDPTRPKLSDFGLAGQEFDLSLSASLRTNDQGAAGTAAYMTPSRLRGRSARSKDDLYALGVMLFEATTGALPRGPEVPRDRDPSLPPGVDEAYRLLVLGNAQVGDAVAQFADFQQPREKSSRRTRRPSSSGRIRAAAGESRRLRSTRRIPGVRASSRVRQIWTAGAIVGLGCSLVLAWAVVSSLSHVGDPAAAPTQVVDATEPSGVAEPGAETPTTGAAGSTATTSAVDRSPKTAGPATPDAAKQRAQVDALIDQATERTRRGDYAGAIADATTAIQSGATKSRAWFARAAAKREIGDLDGAKADFDEAIERNPTNARIWRNRAIIKRMMGDLLGSAEDLGRAIELDPAYTAAWLDRGALRYNAGDFAGAVADTSIAIRLDPTIAGAWNNRGLARKELGDLREALADYGRSLELDPSVALVWVNRSSVRKRLGDVEGALDDCDRAIRLDPRTSQAWVNRSHLKLLKDDAAGALSDAERAVGLNPSDPQAWENRASAKGSLGDFDGAIADCERVLELAPDSSEALWLLARAKDLAGRLSEAARDYERFLALAPRHPWAPKAREDLDRLRANLEEDEPAPREVDAGPKVDADRPQIAPEPVSRLPADPTLTAKVVNRLVTIYLQDAGGTSDAFDALQKLRAADPRLLTKPVRGGIRNQQSRTVALELAHQLRVPGLTASIKRFLEDDEHRWLVLHLLLGTGEEDGLSLVVKHWADSSDLVDQEAIADKLKLVWVPYVGVLQQIKDLMSAVETRDPRRQWAAQILQLQMGLPSADADALDREWGRHKRQFTLYGARFSLQGEALDDLPWRVDKDRLRWVQRNKVLEPSGYLTLRPVPQSWQAGSFVLKLRVLVVEGDGAVISFKSAQGTWYARLDGADWMTRGASKVEFRLPCKRGEWSEIEFDVDDVSQGAERLRRGLNITVDGKRLLYGGALNGEIDAFWINAEESTVVVGGVEILRRR